MDLYNIDIHLNPHSGQKWEAVGWSLPDRKPIITEVNGEFHETTPVMYVAYGRTKRQARRKLQQLANRHPLSQPCGITEESP
jgi:hypothetical protein